MINTSYKDHLYVYAIYEPSKSSIVRTGWSCDPKNCCPCASFIYFYLYTFSLPSNDFTGIFHFHYFCSFNTYFSYIVFNSYNFSIRIDRIDLSVAPCGTILIDLYKRLFSIFLYTFIHLYIHLCIEICI